MTHFNICIAHPAHIDLLTHFAKEFMLFGTWRPLLNKKFEHFYFEQMLDIVYCFANLNCTPSMHAAIT